MAIGPHQAGDMTLRFHFLLPWLLLASLLLSSCRHGLAARNAGDIDAETSTQEKQCMNRGWKRVAMQVAGVPRELLWKAPAGQWKKGAILVMHGGAGEHFQWCVANASVVAPQVR